MRPALALAGLVGVASPVLIQPIHAQPGDRVADPASIEVSAAAETAEPVATTYGEGLVVTATLDEEAAEEIPASISVIGAEEIAARQAAGAAELLRTVPGVHVARSGSPGKVTSLFVRGAASTQTLVLWNGLRLNDPMFGGYDWAFLPTEGVERIEVVRGPFSALYGGDAAGGVVQVLTGRRRGLSLRLEGGEDGYRRGALAAGFGGDGSSQQRLHLDLTGHLRRGDGELDNDFFDGEEATARLSFEPAPGASLGLLARASDSEVGVPLGGFGGTPTPQQTNRRESRELAAPFRLDRAGWELEGHAGWITGDFVVTDPGDPFAAGATDAETAVGRAVATWRPARRFGGADLWIAGGGEWQEQEASTVSAMI
jgi:vitamin B12 transporter